MSLSRALTYIASAVIASLAVKYPFLQQYKAELLPLAVGLAGWATPHVADIANRIGLENEIAAALTALQSSQTAQAKLIAIKGDNPNVHLP